MPTTQTTKAKASNGGSEAQRLKQIMAECGYATNQQLATDVGVSVNTIANYLAGKTEPAVAIIKYLALKRDVKRLVG